MARNHETNQIAEVKFRVSCGEQDATVKSNKPITEVEAKKQPSPTICTNLTNRKTVWYIQWLDASCKTNKSAKVEYPDELLKQGAEFYQQTFRQLWLTGWKDPQLNDCVGLEKDFWKGAEQADWSRQLAKENLDVTSEDLKPPGANSTRATVMERLKAKRK